jgi:hypothetical protein
MGFAYVPGLTAAQKDFGGTEDITLDESNAASYLRSLIEHMVATRGLDPFCGICKSTNLTYDDQPSIFKTIDEALPVMRKLEEQQLQAREFYRASRN